MVQTVEQDFAGDVVLITGAGAGLGRAYATYLAARGASVVVNDLDRDRAEAVVGELRTGGGTAVAAAGSVTDPAACSAMVATAVEEFGRLDALVNNAGIGRIGRLTRTSDDAIRGMIEVHLLGTIWATRAALLVMEEAGSGRIVVTSSGVGAFGSPRSSVYGAAKGGVIGLMRSLALDVAETGIRINAISPIADTGLSDGFYRHYPDLPRERYTADVVAPTTAYLCHRDCALNGAWLSVGGGRTARVATVTSSGFHDPAATHQVIAAHVEEVRSLVAAIEPASALDEFTLAP